MNQESKRHSLKTLPVHFNDIMSGIKTAEIRLNDRRFSVGDTLILREWKERYTGRLTPVKVTHILDDSQKGIDSGYVMLSFGRIK